MRPFGDPTLVRTARNDRGVLEYQYGLHLGREDVVSVYSRTIWLRLNTNSIVPECESKLAQGTSEFIGKLVGLDGTIIHVENGHDASVIFGLSASPVAFIVPDYSTPIQRQSIGVVNGSGSAVVFLREDGELVCIEWVGEAGG